MTGPESFQVGIAIDARLKKRLVTERIACHHHTQTLLEQPHDPRVSEKKHQYRSKILNTLKVAAQSSITKIAESSKNDASIRDADEAITKFEASEQIVRNFVNLAETLRTSKALGMHFEDTKHGEKSARAQIWTGALRDINHEVYTSLSHQVDLFDHPSIRAALLHPLLVALLAYRMGGPINAANTAYAYNWALPEASLTQEQNFHIEGGGGDFFDDHRITMVWELKGGETKAMSGNHSIFLSDDATPRPLVLIDAARGFEPTTIIYDSQNATLYYDCQDPKVVRQSITLDFHFNTITNEDLHMSTAAADEKDLRSLALAKLLVGYPIANYDAHFHRLLFSVKSLNAMLTKLYTLHVPQPEPDRNPPKHSLQQRFNRYKKDNKDSIPVSMRNVESKVSISGIYSHPASFRRNLWAKACRDVHLTLGMDLVPQTLLDENRECARKSIRDMSEASIAVRLARYASVLVQKSYTNQDLLSTAQLYRAAKLIEQRSLALIGAGFIDKASNLSSVAAFAYALGNALNGLKEIQVTPEPWVFGSDLQTFGARCLYLFWCSDWLTCYLDEPNKGPCMIIDARTMSRETTEVKLEMERVAGSLLRNWVAWGMFTEELPQGGFCVRRPFDVAF